MRFRSGGWDPRDRGRILGLGASIGAPLCCCQANVVENSKRCSVHSGFLCRVTSTHRPLSLSLARVQTQFSLKIKTCDRKTADNQTLKLELRRDIGSLNPRHACRCGEKPFLGIPAPTKEIGTNVEANSRFSCCKWTENRLRFPASEFTSVWSCKLTRTSFEEEWGFLYFILV